MEPRHRFVTAHVNAMPPPCRASARNGAGEGGAACASSARSIVTSQRSVATPPLLSLRSLTIHSKVKRGISSSSRSSLIGSMAPPEAHGGSALRWSATRRTTERRSDFISSYETKRTATRSRGGYAAATRRSRGGLAAAMRRRQLCAHARAVAAGLCRPGGGACRACGASRCLRDHTAHHAGRRPLCCARP